MNKRAVVHRLNGYTYCIDDAGESCCYVVCGSERAAVIDTLNGKENLREIVREITKLEPVVINTHGHCDHIYGNTFFDVAYIHPDDIKLHDKHFEMKLELSPESAAVWGAAAADFKKYVEAKPCPLRTVLEGDKIELGKISLEVIRIKGHTQGSIALLDRESGNFFTGDAINKGQFWLQLEESSSLAEYEKSLAALAPYRSVIKELHGGHSVEAYEPEFIEIMSEGINEIIRNNGEGDGTERWFGKTACSHILRNKTQVLYTRDKLGA